MDQEFDPSYSGPEQFGRKLWENFYKNISVLEYTEKLSIQD
jgi:hypothetical protein